MKAAIVIDDWKLPIFERHLKKAGYEYTSGPGLSPGTLMLIVITTATVTEMQPVIAAANNEAAATKRKP